MINLTNITNSINSLSTKITTATSWFSKSRFGQLASTIKLSGTTMGLISSGLGWAISQGGKNFADMFVFTCHKEIYTIESKLGKMDLPENANLMHYVKNHPIKITLEGVIIHNYTSSNNTGINDDNFDLMAIEVLRLKQYLVPIVLATSKYTGLTILTKANIIVNQGILDTTLEFLQLDFAEVQDRYNKNKIKNIATNTSTQSIRTESNVQDFLELDDIITTIL